MGTGIMGWVGKGREKTSRARKPCPHPDFFVEGSRQPLKFAFRKATGCRVEMGWGLG